MSLKIQCTVCSATAELEGSEGLVSIPVGWRAIDWRSLEPDPHAEVLSQALSALPFLGALVATEVKRQPMRIVRHCQHICPAHDITFVPKKPEPKESGVVARQTGPMPLVDDEFETKEESLGEQLVREAEERERNGAPEPTPEHTPP